VLEELPYWLGPEAIADEEFPIQVHSLEGLETAFRTTHDLDFDKILEVLI